MNIQLFLPISIKWNIGCRSSRESPRLDVEHLGQCREEHHEKCFQARRGIGQRRASLEKLIDRIGQRIDTQAKGRRSNHVVREPWQQIVHIIFEAGYRWLVQYLLANVAIIRLRCFV